VIAARGDEEDRKGVKWPIPGPVFPARPREERLPDEGNPVPQRAGPFTLLFVFRDFHKIPQKIPQILQLFEERLRLLGLRGHSCATTRALDPSTNQALRPMGSDAAGERPQLRFWLTLPNGLRIRVGAATMPCQNASVERRLYIPQWLLAQASPLFSL
jgi:hypothetical protein